MSKSLLSHIATKFIKEYENAANSSVAYLLNEYPSALIALRNYLGVNNIPNNYETEVSTKDNGRLDIAGKNSDGKISLIIEGKFWANLTDNQPNSYLKELDEDGILLFIAPERRLESLKHEIINRTINEDKRIYYISWNHILTLIENENNKHFDMQLNSDLMQLKELCEKMDEEGMPPLSNSDLSPMNGRINFQFADLIDECNKLMRQWDKADFKGLKTVGFKDGYGFYFRAFDFGCQLCFSNYDWYTKDSQTPYYIYIWDKDFKEDKNIYHFLTTFDKENTYNDFASYAITLKAGMDKKEIVNHLVDKSKEVLYYLDSKFNLS